MSALANLSFDVTVDAIAIGPLTLTFWRKPSAIARPPHPDLVVSAYDDPPKEGATEETATSGTTRPRADAEVTAETYGPLKAACERAAQEHFGDRLTFVRPTFVIGSHDATLRFPTGRAPPPGGNVAFPDLVTTPSSTSTRVTSASSSSRSRPIRRSAPSTRGPYPGPFYDVIQTISEQISPSDTRLVEISPRHIKSHHLDSRFPSGRIEERDRPRRRPRQAVAAVSRFVVSARAWRTSSTGG